MKIKTKIALINVFFGQLPDYFDLWVKSCRYNDIDFFVFTDSYIHCDLPKNVTVIKLTLADFVERLNSKLDLALQAIQPYKICDYRPAFGVIFNDYLESYDFWGHCDIDLVFGDIRKFITEDILERFDCILHRGHLILYRNTKKVNRYYQLPHPNVNYLDVFTQQSNFKFDEWNGMYLLLKHHNIPVYHDEFIAETDPQCLRFHCSNIPNYSRQVFYWEDGRVFQAFEKNNEIKYREVAYIHFLKRNLIKQDDIAGSFYCTPCGFFSKSSGVPTLLDLRKYNSRNFSHVLSYSYRRISQKIKSFVA